MKTIIFSDNTKAKVIDESGKYYITKKAQFRKNNPYIAEVIEEADAPEEKPKAKKSAQKKAEEKKGE